MFSLPNTFVEHYNKYATQLEPPCPALSWDQIANFTFAGEFDLLRETDKQVHAKHWANPTNCQATMKSFDLQHSREEITHCNVEIVRLLTKMHDDELNHTAAIVALKTHDPSLAAEIQMLPGYSGKFGPGICLGHHFNATAGAMLSDSQEPGAGEEDVEQDGSGMGEINDALDGILQCLEETSLGEE
ncbi:hypothetical protein EDB19DRAFT_1912699 [Suillus lakei]|nr:hypothetical protein EDB19DRAFT_1912699 [Suillus lakei]